MKVLTNPEQFAANNRACMESLLTVADSFMTLTGRLMDANVGFASGLVEEGMAKARMLASARDVQSWLFFPTALVQPLMERSANYARDVSGILAEQQQGLAEIVDARVGAVKQTLVQELDYARRAAPGGSEVLLESMKSALAAGSAAYEQASKSARELAAFSETKLIESVGRAALPANK
ncbi:MAG: phasin family protein [Proteobacteria bacterium]|nr:phasin family protein [Pseudomonadota bacterium]